MTSIRRAAALALPILVIVADPGSAQQPAASVAPAAVARPAKSEDAIVAPIKRRRPAQGTSAPVKRPALGATRSAKGGTHAAKKPRTVAAQVQAKH